MTKEEVSKRYGDSELDALLDTWTCPLEFEDISEDSVTVTIHGANEYINDTTGDYVDEDMTVKAVITSSDASSMLSIADSCHDSSVLSINVRTAPQVEFSKDPTEGRLVQSAAMTTIYPDTSAKYRVFWLSVPFRYEEKSCVEVLLPIEICDAIMRNEYHINELEQ